MSQRKAFNFYKSYFDTASELEDKDRLAFYDALILRQFTGLETELKGMAKFAYISQKHSIDSQVAGFETKTKAQLNQGLPINLPPPTVGGTQGGTEPPTVQGEEKGKEKGKEKEDIDSRKLKFAHTLKPFLLMYGKDILNDFYAYWAEPNKSKTKFKQEMEKTWDLERRLSTWKKNESQFNPKLKTEKL